jgi:gas vesicle protein
MNQTTKEKILRKLEIDEEEFNELFLKTSSYVTQRELDSLAKSLATKEDISHLRSELKEDISHLRSELKEDISHLRSELKEDIRALDQRIFKMTLYLGVFFTILMTIYKFLS